VTSIKTADLTQCFDVFTHSAFRLETLPRYTVAGEAERLTAFRLGLPRPERSVRTSPWLARIARTTAAGKSWRRVRILDHPLTEYQRYQLIGYQESDSAGDVIRIAERQTHPELARLTRDFWLFDQDALQPFAALMCYDDQGSYLESEITTNPEVIKACRQARDLAERFAVPLHTFLAHVESSAA
jgi:hypothetical protein